MKKLLMICLMAVLGFGICQAAPEKDKKTLKTTVFVTDIHCQGCANRVTNNAHLLGKIEDLKIDLPTKRITVTYDPAKNSDEALVKNFLKVKVKATPETKATKK